jgi:uncharacterized protein DUF4325
MTFSVRSYGEVFSTRHRGAALLDELIQQAAGADRVEVDFSNVRSVSFSFADEFVGLLVQRVADGEYDFDVALESMSERTTEIVFGSLKRRGVAKIPLAHA